MRLVSEGRLELVDVPLPRITADDQVLIRVNAVGVCGSEVHAFQGTHPYRKAPVILGHEVAGDVVTVGAAVSTVRPGDRVYVDPQWTCGQCSYCQNGMPNLCPEKRVLGTDAWPGGFGEMIIAPASSVFPLPGNLTYAQGCLIEPLTVALHVVGRSSVQPGQTAAVLGTGSIGGLVVGALHAKGIETIIAADIRQHCLDAAVKMGAAHGFLLPRNDFLTAVLDAVDGHGVDAVFITADDAQLVNYGIQMSKRLGCIVLVSLITDEPLRIQAFDIISKEISIIGSLMANHEDVRSAIALASSGTIQVSNILTHVMPARYAQQAVEYARNKADGAIKVVLSWE